MLNRIFSRKGKDKSALKGGQGSLLDLLEETTPPNGNIIDFDTGRPSNESLLSTINNVEIEAQRARQVAYASQISAQSTSQNPSPASWNSAAPGLQSVGLEPSSSEVSQQQQLELLSRELDELAGRAREHENADVRRNSADPLLHQEINNASPTGPAPFQYPRNLNPFSFNRVVGALLQGWWVIIACALIGACLAAIYALSMPNKYLSVAEVLIEPRGFTVIENTVSPNGLNSEATVAYAESQVRILTSSSVIDPVIEDLELANDSEFNGKKPAGGLLGQIVNAVFGDPDDPGANFSSAKEYLYENMYVTRINQTFTIQIGVTTEEPSKSARIANAIALAYMNAESTAKSSAARNATQDLTGRLDELRTSVRMSEEKVEAYKAENGLVDAEGKLVSEVQLTRLNDRLAIARAQNSDARSRAKQAGQADLSDVLSGSLPTALVSPTVSQLRVQYSRAKAQLDKISTKLGERHPERIGAQAELRSARQAIAGELERIVESAQEDYRSARTRLADINSQVNSLKANAVTDSAAKVKLRELEREVEANRKVYEAYLLRARETGEQENIRTQSARIISEATPPIEKEGPNRKLITLTGGFAGGGLGMLLVLIPFTFRALREVASGGGGYSPVLSRATYDGDLYSSRAPGHAPDEADQSEQRGVQPQRSPIGEAPVTRSELEALKEQMRVQSTAQPNMQPQMAAQPQPVQMPLFTPPVAQPYAPPPYAAYPAPVMSAPMVYAPAPVPVPVQPVMPQPVQMVYPAWPQPAQAPRREGEPTK